MPHSTVAVQPTSPAVDLRALTRALSRYRGASNARGLVEILITILPLSIVWILMWTALCLGYGWLYALLIVPAAALLVRLFMIQHDCGHGAFLRSRRANDLVGRVIGVLTLTPYDYWRRTHAAHHAGAGNLGRRGMGDVATLTVSEYQARSKCARFCYRLYRHPLVMFGVGPFYLFFIQNRLPVGLMRAGKQPWISSMLTNVGIAFLAGSAIWLVGVNHFLLLYVPVGILAGSAGVWLFYIQHQFEETLWVDSERWNALEAALHGSSHYDLPMVLRWFTANIGVHHVHHLVSGIPYYRLPDVLRDFPFLRDKGRLTLLQSFRCVRLVLWDEESRRLVSFRNPAAVPLTDRGGPSLKFR